MRILVTGGAGFIGSHLCDRLIDKGYDVLCLDNLFTGRTANIAHLIDHSRFKFIEADVTRPIAYEVDQIYHLACPASPVHYQLDEAQTLKTCFLGTLHVLELAKKLGIRILQASTSEVYGDPLEHPQAETYWGNVNPIGLRACYDEGKRVGEALCFSFKRQYATDVRMVRIFNTYGPRMLAHDGRVVSNFIVQALSQKPLTVYGRGEQTRSFCYVDDLVSGIIQAMEQPMPVGPINLGNPSEFTVAELAQRVLHLTGSHSVIEYLPLPADDPRRRKPDIRLAQEKMNWSPQVDLEVGLMQTIAYFQQVLGLHSKNGH